MVKDNKIVSRDEFMNLIKSASSAKRTNDRVDWDVVLKQIAALKRPASVKEIYEKFVLTQSDITRFRTKNALAEKYEECLHTPEIRPYVARIYEKGMYFYFVAEDEPTIKKLVQMSKTQAKMQP
jgi:hypothetical protein